MLPVRLPASLLVFAILTPALAQAPADTPVDPDTELRLMLEQAREEIRLLRSEVAQMKKQSAWQYRQELDATLAEVELPTAARDDDHPFKLPAGWTFQPYGYFKTDLSYDDSPTVGDNGNYVVWVNSENDLNRSDDRLSMTVRETRLGFNLGAPDYGDLKISARAEIDFTNSPITAENKGSVLLRHAYGQVLADDWSFIFGQTSDIISPLVPTTLNYTVGWFAGNIGYRHPQLRFTKWFECPDEGRFQLESSLSKEIRQDLDGFGVDDGQDAAMPTLMGRASYSTPFAGKRLEAGLSGHFGREEIDWDYPGDDNDVSSWSVNADLVLPLSEKLEAKGEFFYGENLDSLFGGIGQGVNPLTADEIASTGGWFQLGYRPTKAWAFYSGAGMDNPKDSDLAPAARSNNYFVFGNAQYYFTDFLSTGLELSYWRTDYHQAPAGDDVRIQHSWRLNF